MDIAGYIATIFKDIESEKISYCHWKSNSHLDDSFSCETDFDILVSRNDVDRFRAVLENYGMKRRWSTADKAYNFMEDFVGMHPETGTLFHFHLHYRLIMGAKYDKNYVIPIEQEVLRDSIINQEYGIRIISPEWEMLLLMTRIILKTDVTIKNIAKLFLGRQIAPKNIDKEYFYLDKQSKIEVLKECFKAPHPIPNKILKVPYLLGMTNKCDLLARVIDGLKFYLLKFEVIWVLRNERVRSGWAHYKEKRARLIYSKIGVRGSTKGGFAMAFIGADGSGKSTTVSIIKKWLSWKYSVVQLYMGIPKKNFVWDTSKYLLRLIRALKLNYFSEVCQNLRWLYLSYFRYQQFQKSIELKNSGYIVIMDRYPHPAFDDMDEPMDGPRISTSSFFSKYERLFYSKIKSPDIIFALKVTLEESVRRKEEHELEHLQEMIKNKIEAMEKLCRSEERVIEINTCRQRDEVILDIKEKIWEMV